MFLVIVEGPLVGLPLECSGGVAVSGRKWVNVGDNIMVVSQFSCLQSFTSRDHLPDSQDLLIIHSYHGLYPSTQVANCVTKQLPMGGSEPTITKLLRNVATLALPFSAPQHLSVCLFVCSCLFAGLTAARINLKFGMNTHIWSDCAIGYMILTFEVIKGHFRTNKFLCKVP